MLGQWGLNVLPSQFTNFDSRFQLDVYNGGGTAVTYSALAVNAAGNIGIGTTQPTQKLEVAGNVKFGCPSGMTSYGRGCISGVQAGTNAYAAVTNCLTTFGGTICMYNEVMRACAAGVISSYNADAVVNWMGNRSGTDHVS